MRILLVLATAPLLLASTARADAPAVPQTVQAPLIDGHPEPIWDKAIELPITNAAGGAVSDKNDLSGSVRLLWDASALYVYVVVNDETRKREEESPREDDAVEVLVDADGTRPARMGGRQAAFTYRWEDEQLRAPIKAGVEHAQANRQGGYRMEMKLPWAAAGGPPAGTIGFEVLINDDDDGGKRDGRVAWAGTGEQAGKSPAQFGQLRLTRADGKPYTPRAARPATRAYDKHEVVFADDFGPASRGEKINNVVQLPPPRGLSYTTRYPQGHRPTKWTQVDEKPAGDPLRGFWIVPENEEVMVQAGRSIPSYVFANSPVPADARDYDIEFVQYRHDNDPIGYILGAEKIALPHGGTEVITYETQVPGSDRTTPHLYMKGPLGQAILADVGGNGRWLRHRIEVRGKRVRWLQEERVLAEGTVPQLRAGGYFGIRHVSERDTAYDDVRIVVRRRGSAPRTTTAQR